MENVMEAMLGETYIGRWRVPLAGFRWHEVDGIPWLVADTTDARERVYPVLRRPRLVEAFATLGQDATMDAVLGFASDWGPLTQGRLAVAEGASPVEKLRARLARLHGDPFPDWSRAAGTFADTVDLWRAVTGATDPAGRRILRERVGKRPDGSYWYDGREGAHSIPWPMREGRQAVPGTLERVAEHYVHLRVNHGLRGQVSPAVLPFQGSAVRFYPHSLVGAAYLLLAGRLARGKGRERACEHCGLAFLPGRRDQRYCGKNCREKAGYHERARRARQEGSAT